MLLFGLMASIIFSIIYAYGIIYIPFVYLNVFFALGYSILVGMVAGLGAKKGKIRNMKWMFCLSLFIGICAEYINWVSWVYVLSKHEILILFPSDVIDAIKYFFENRIISIAIIDFKGIWIALIWAIEGIGIIVVTLFSAMNMIWSTPFCEKCNCWVETKTEISFLEPIKNPEQLIKELEARNYSSLIFLKNVNEDSKAYTTVNLLSCPVCESLCFLTLTSVTLTEDEEGETDEDEDTIVENIIISTDAYKRLTQFMESQPSID
jgi:hypothetical protein